MNGRGQVVLEYFLIGTTLTLITVGALWAMGSDGASRRCEQVLANAVTGESNARTFGCMLRSTMERFMREAALLVGR